MSHALEPWILAPLVAAVAATVFADLRSYERRVDAVALAHDAAGNSLDCADALARVTAAARSDGLRLAGAAATTSGAAPDQLFTVTIELAPEAVPWAGGPDRRTATATFRRRDQAAAACAERLGT